MSEREEPMATSSELRPRAFPGGWSLRELGTIAAAVLTTSAAFIDATALNVAMPALQRELGASGPELLWTVNAYGVMVASLLLLGGAAADRFGRRRICQLGLMVFALASLGCGQSVSARSLIGSRAVQGFGAALMIPASLAVVASGVAPGRRGGAIGLWSALSVVITALGPVLGGFFVKADLWRYVFFINIPLAALALLALQLWVTESRDEHAPPHVDWPGASLAAWTLGCFSYGLIQTGDANGNHAQVVGALALACLGFLGFLRVEARSPHPLLPLPLFRDPTIRAACSVNLLFFSSIYGMMFFSQ